MKDLQFEYELIVEEVEIVIKLFVKCVDVIVEWYISSEMCDVLIFFFECY